ncbi:MAG: hypothetical protein U5N58_03500 [Actinomycetota bacterium]|nr:hypothetical protein [Actinomycetota bacterium]
MLSKFKVSGFLAQGLKQLEQYLYDFTQGLEGVLKQGVTNTLLAGEKE